MATKKKVTPASGVVKTAKKLEDIRKELQEYTHTLERERDKIRAVVEEAEELFDNYSTAIEDLNSAIDKMSEIV